MNTHLTPKCLDERMNVATVMEQLLPFFHSCDAFFLRPILEEKRLSPTDCHVFNEKILYLFYGRPAYKCIGRPSCGLDSFLPISFILKSEPIQNIIRIAPFDTGAYKKDLYKEFLHPKMEMSSFFLSPTKESISKTVAYFFETNHQYFAGKPKHEVTFDPLDFEIQSYHELIKGVFASKADDRKATIEVQLTDAIHLSEDTIEAIILPENFLSSDLLQEVLVENCKVEVLTYESFGLASDQYYSETLRLTKQYLIKKNYIHAY